MTTPDQINLWRQAPSEHQRLEFKEAKNQFDFGKLQQYCVALANEGGGTLLLGVADKPPRPVVGSRAFPDTVKTAQDLFQAIGFRVDVENVVHPDGRVVVLHIPSRPRGTAYHLEGKNLMRTGEALVPMSEDQLRRIFAEVEPNWLEEHAITGADAQQAAELYQLPAPDLRAGHRRTVATLYGPKAFDEMDRNDRVRACYQHCALKWVMAEKMTNQSLRERFRLGEDKAAIASQVIAAATETGLIKPDESVGKGALHFCPGQHPYKWLIFQRTRRNMLIH